VFQPFGSARIPLEKNYFAESAATSAPGRRESVTELTPFMKFLVKSYTCCSDRQNFIRRWISMGFTPFTTQKTDDRRCSSVVHVARGAAIFTQLLHRRVAFLHRTATCRSLLKPWVSLLSTYKTTELCFEFLSHFSVFHLTLPRIYGTGVRRKVFMATQVNLRRHFFM
jgi:hypothetical protein